MLTRDKIKKVFGIYIPTLIRSGAVKLCPPLYKYITFRPFFAVLNITDNCCFKCTMCGQWKRPKPSELSTEKWKDILKQLKERGIQEVVFSGGEPFLRKDLIDIISYAKSLQLSAGIITNGFLLDRPLFDKLINIGIKSISISIDGNENKFDKTRGIRGAYKKVINSCEILSEFIQKNLLNGYLSFILMKNSVNNYVSALKMSTNLGIPLVVNLIDFTPYFFKSLEKEKDSFWINNNGDFRLLKELQKEIIAKKSKEPLIIYHTYSEIEYFRKYFKDPLQKDVPCTVSQQRIGIDSQGNVYGGCWSMSSFGNLKEKSLKEIISSPKYKVMHKNMFLKRCPGCSCGYSKNLRYYLPSLIKEGLFRIAPFTRESIWR